MAIENYTGIDDAINSALAPIADAISDFVFYSIHIGGADLPLIVIWLVVAAVFFTFYFGFTNVRGLAHAIRIVKGDFIKPGQKGEIHPFKALTTAISGTVGIGNIGGVAIAISMGGPGAMFWLIVAGFLGMSTKLVECIAGVKYRRYNPDGSVSGGPMFYLEGALRERGLNFLARPMGIFYALTIVIGCLGIGNMFQSNQAFTQFVYITGDTTSQFADFGWLFGLCLAVIVGIVIIGGIKRIGNVASVLVPFMGLAYVLLGIVIVILNADKVPWAIGAIFSEAFQPDAVSGGVLGVMILGFQRALFSNEAGLGSAAIAHSSVQTDEPSTEGYVGLLEPFIDTVIICTLTAMVILTTVYEPGLAQANVQGVELTSRAFGSTLPWSVGPLSVIAILFAFSTIMAWSYYGLKGWTYLFGEGYIKELIFKSLYCVFVMIGATVQLDALLKFADATIFLIALPNIIGLYLLAPSLKKELHSYQAKHGLPFNLLSKVSAKSSSTKA